LAIAATAALNAEWAYAFNDGFTFEGTFQLLDGREVDALIMKQSGIFPYISGDNFEAFDLPLKETDLSMLILLPDSGKFQEFEESLDYSLFEGIIDNLESSRLSVLLPKFSFDSNDELYDTFVQLGITNALEEGEADFSGVNDIDDLYINGGRFNAKIAVSESGVKGAGSSVVTIEGNEEIPIFVFTDDGFTVIGDGLIIWAMNPNLASPPIVEVEAIRPFILFIRDTRVGSILFMGRVINP
jgi:serpin B